MTSSEATSSSAQLEAWRGFKAAARRSRLPLTRERVHPLEVPFTQAIKTVSRWGSGSEDLVAAMTK